MYNLAGIFWYKIWSLRMKMTILSKCVGSIWLFDRQNYQPTLFFGMKSKLGNTNS